MCFVDEVHVQRTRKDVHNNVHRERFLGAKRTHEAKIDLAETCEQDRRNKLLTQAVRPSRHG